MKTLPVNIEEFGFVEREEKNGEYIKNRCGRDFLYYALHYFYPSEFSPQKNNPQEIERKGIFGLSVPSWLAWTQAQFIHIPKLLASKNLTLSINGREINSFNQFARAILTPNGKNGAAAIDNVEKIVDSGDTVGIDIALGFGGLLDHIMFVYGYDTDNFYICDTHKAAGIEYTKLFEGNRYFMRLPKAEILKRWTRFGRVWEVKRK
ncbi:MAG: hypothetical protein HYY10_04195 [Candidatus Liptonbacteria bacterium]|nr:hypothetical protein [Candidatus Liptonbacteria bacterium]